MITRRNFLKNTALGSGLVFAPSFAMSAAKKIGANDTINVALVGVGSQGTVLLESLVKIPGIRIVAICDIWEFRRKYGVAYAKKMSINKGDVNGYEDHRDLIAKEKDLDAAIIATPDFWHSPQTCDFLNAGINVYCEKMMAESVESAKKMVRAMRSSKKLLQIGHQRTSNPRYHFVRDVLLREHQICGRLVNANGQWNRGVTDDLVMPEKYQIPQATLDKYGFKDAHQFRNWRWFKGLGGGPISDLGAHQIDVFGWFFGGRPKSVMASGDNSYYKREWFDNVMTILEYDTFQGYTARAFYQVLTATSAGGGYFEQFMGDEGTIRMSENPALTAIFRENRAPDWAKFIEAGILKNSASGAAAADTAIADARESKALVSYEINKTLEGPIHMPHLVNYFNAIRGLEPLNCDGEHAYEREAAVFKIVQAIEAKKTLFFEDSDFVVED